MSTTGPEPTEDELRAAYEAELKKIRVEQILLEHVVTMVNLGMRRTGMAPGAEDERDLGQVQLAIEAIRVAMPLIEQIAPPQAAQVRQALSQLQLAYVRSGGAGPPAPGEAPAAPGGPGQPAPESGPPPGGGPGQPPAGGPVPPPAGGPAEAPGGPPPKPGEAGPAQRSGRLWIPGQ